MDKKKITIAVTALNAIDSPGPGVPVIRALREMKDYDVRIIGLAYESLEPGIYMEDMADKTYMMPYPSSGTKAMMERLEYINDKENIDILIPNFDAEILNYIKKKGELEQMGIKMLIPSEEQFNDRQKNKLNEFGDRYDIRVPKSKEIFSIAELEKLGQEEFQYPLVVKGKFYEAYIAYSYDQAVAYFYKIMAKWGAPVIIQQFIKGQEYNLTGLGDGKGHLIGGVPMRKTFITDKGKAWAGISIKDNELIEMAEKFVSNTKWAGGFELEVMKEDKTNHVYLIEINPRFPAWLYFANGCGQNHPEALVKILLGEDVKPYETYQTGKMFIRYSYDLICDMSDYAQLSTQGEV